ncbi:MAG: hypothetical protein BJ554DRAFT_118 [Olpidium bornovanus]|uniref:PH domain-containing protein n=1 Tax=Olpidium bornovanus TaxID=278681 RepID=A0A8H8DI42_9FUNG|nr:MAG: hypothetical protein BJ554DRAFT_118 [Olpidium bornovanus]
MFRYSFVLHITTVAAGGLTLDHQFFTNAQETRDKWISDLSEALQENAANPSVADITKLLALGDDEEEISVRTAPLSGGLSGDDDDWSGSGMAGSGGWSRAVSSENFGGKSGLVKIDRWNSWDSVTLLGGNKVRRHA